MYITELGLILLPFCAIYALNMTRLIQILIIGSAFNSAAVAVVGTFGVGPTQIPLLLLLMNALLQTLLGFCYKLHKAILGATAPFVFTALYATACALILPYLFAEQVYVWPQKSDSFEIAKVLLAPGSGNITQSIYVVANAGLLVVAALQGSESVRQTNSVFSAIITCGFIVSIIACWQFTASFTGAPYPTEFFHSNPGWAQLSDQIYAGVSRINGSFAEPSSLASYMFAIVCSMGWMVIKGHRGRTIRALFCLSLLTILISTSTTGYAALAIAFAGLIAYANLSGSSRLARRVHVAAATVVFGLFLTTIIAFTLIPRVQTVASAIWSETLDKGQSSSYENRSAADIDSLDLVLPTFGFGVGWGSNRSASLIPGLVAGLGIYGLLLLCWFAWRVISIVRKATSVPPPSNDARAIDCFTGYVVGTLLAACISSPTIGDADFYLVLGMLIGAASRTIAQRRVCVPPSTLVQQR